MRGALLTLLWVAGAAAQDQTGSIEGTVLDAASRQPVKKAAIMLNALGAGISNGHAPNAGPQNTITDFSGKFTFENLAAGQYQVTVMHQSYPQARMGEARRTVQVTSGVASVTVELVPGASVTGHIVDDDGDPLSGCNVSVNSAKNPSQGVPMSGSGSRDDGVYRIYDIPPGRYLLNAQCFATVFEPRPLSAGPDPPPTAAYPMQFYPAASDFKSAEVVELSPGAERSGVDFRMKPVPVTSIHGTIAPGSPAWHDRNLQVTLVALDRATPPRFGAGWFGPVNPKDGTFELRRVFPGSYKLVAFSQVSGRPGSQPDTSDQVGAVMRVDVADKPLEVSLPLHGTINISGTIDIERGTDTNRQITPSQIWLQLASVDNPAPAPMPVEVKDDGTFTIENVLPGEWWIHANGPGLYVKSVWLASDEVTHRPLDLTSGAAPPLRIIVSTNTATIRGTAPLGQSVFAERIDDDDPQHIRMGAQVDANGQFTMPNLAPGRYRVVVQDGPFLSGDGGQEVTVQEGETAAVDLK